MGRCDQALCCLESKEACISRHCSCADSEGTEEDAPQVNGAGALDCITRLGQQTANQASGPACSGLDGAMAARWEGCAHGGRRVVVLWQALIWDWAARASETAHPRASDAGRGVLQMRDVLEGNFAGCAARREMQCWLIIAGAGSWELTRRALLARRIEASP